MYVQCSSNISFIIFGTIWISFPYRVTIYTQLQIANEVLLSRGVRDDEFEFQEYLDSLIMKMKCLASKGQGEGICFCST